MIDTVVALMVAFASLRLPTAAAAVPLVPPQTDNARELSKYHHWQKDLPLCGFYTELGILEAYTGSDFPVDELFGWYVATGTFDVRGSGVPVTKLGDALGVKRLPVSRQKIRSEAELTPLLGAGYAVMAVVEPDFYWQPDDPMTDFYDDIRRRRGVPLATHVVWVTDDVGGFVFINDTALKDGGGMRVPWTQFEPAWAASDFQAVIVKRTLPPTDPDGDGKAFATSEDRDGDGEKAVWAGGTDCADDDAARHTGAPENWADRIDSDCDGNDWVPANGTAGITTGHIVNAIQNRIAGCLSRDSEGDGSWGMRIPQATNRIFGQGYHAGEIECELRTLPYWVPVQCHLIGDSILCSPLIEY